MGGEVDREVGGHVARHRHSKAIHVGIGDPIFQEVRVDLLKMRVHRVLGSREFGIWRKTEQTTPKNTEFLVLERLRGGVHYEFRASNS